MEFNFPIIVRHERDPILEAKILTVNTFNFGISSSDMLVIGAVFTFLGVLLSITPLIKIVDYCRQAAKANIPVERHRNR